MQADPLNPSGPGSTSLPSTSTGPGEVLSAQAEQEWEELRAQIEYADNFWFGVLVTSAASVTGVMRARADAFIKAKVGQFTHSCIEHPRDLVSSLQQILDAGSSVVHWFECAALRPSEQRDAHEWDESWRQFLMRLNEHRELLRRQLSGGLLLVIPPDVKPLCRDTAPDIWSILSFVLEPRALPTSISADRSQSVSHVPLPPKLDVSSEPDQDEIAASDGSPAALLRLAQANLDSQRYRAAVQLAAKAIDVLAQDEAGNSSQLATAFRIQADAELANGDPAAALQHYQHAISRSETKPASRSLFLLHWNAVEAAERCGNEAVRCYADDTLLLARELLLRNSNSEQSLRDVSVSLSKVGDVEVAEGNRAAALELYRESLDITRQIVERFGESPQSLRDVSVSLDRVGNVEVAEGNRAAALDLYRASRDIFRRIVERFGESPQSLRDVSVSLEKVGNVELAEGNRAAALDLYRESLDIRRRIVERFGESPESLRDVSVSLDRVGDVELAEGNRAAALDLYRESLDICRRIVERFEESPESLRDVSVSLNKVGDVELAEGNRAAALDLYRESLDIRRRIVERFGESPQSLRDVSVSLEKVGDVEVAEGNRAAALDLYRESLDIRRRIVERFGESPESLWDVFCSEWRMADILTEQAGEFLQRARKAMAALIERDWATADQRPWLQTIDDRINALEED